MTVTSVLATSVRATSVSRTVRAELVGRVVGGRDEVVGPDPEQRPVLRVDEVGRVALLLRDSREHQVHVRGLLHRHLLLLHRQDVPHRVLAWEEPPATLPSVRTKTTRHGRTERQDSWRIAVLFLLLTEVVRAPGQVVRDIGRVVGVLQRRDQQVVRELRRLVAMQRNQRDGMSVD